MCEIARICPGDGDALSACRAPRGGREGGNRWRRGGRRNDLKRHVVRVVYNLEGITALARDRKRGKVRGRCKGAFVAVRKVEYLEDICLSRGVPLKCDVKGAAEFCEPGCCNLVEVASTRRIVNVDVKVAACFLRPGPIKLEIPGLPQITRRDGARN